VTSFKNIEGTIIVKDLIGVIKKNARDLSRIDGLIGDGDHGINMNKGFMLCEKALEKDSFGFSESLSILGKILLTEIGGSMGPLYGSFFISMAKVSEKEEIITAGIFKEMLNASIIKIQKIGNAKLGDKTLLDTLIPAKNAYFSALDKDMGFSEAIEAMMRAAEKGRDSTIGMVAKIGRAARLGDRSIGFPDAGATSCFLILESFGTSIKGLLI
jgi:phosphoenolpyruvate---glycerone phosphotransferase subunit DhaL